MCTIVKSSYGAAVSCKSPYFDKVDLIIGETTCDEKKKMFEYLRNNKWIGYTKLDNKNKVM